MPPSPRPARTVRQARDLIENLNHLLLDEGRNLPVPVLYDTVQALKSLIERLPQAIELSAVLLEMLAERGAIAMDTQEDPSTEAEAAAGELRRASARAEQLARDVGEATSRMFNMGAP